MDMDMKLLSGYEVVIRRTIDEGLAVFAGKSGLPPNTMVALYCGVLYYSEFGLRMASNANDGNDHKVNLRVGRCNMNPLVSGIDGRFVHNPGEDGRVYGLPYYVKNGPANILNARSSRKCNCKLVLEYIDYKNYPMDQLRVDDEYCETDHPFERRVSRSKLSTPHTHRSFNLLCASQPHFSRISFSIA